MNAYELMMLFDPNLGEETIASIVAKVENKIKDLGGEVAKSDMWGARRLASVISKARQLKQAFYVVLFFKAEASLPRQLQDFLHVSENIIRYSIMRAVEKAASDLKGEPIAAAEGAIDAVHVGEIKGEAGGEPK